MYSEVNIPKTRVDVELFLDASNFGWGGALLGRDGIHSTNGTWTHNENCLHINIKNYLHASILSNILKPS